MQKTRIHTAFQSGFTIVEILVVVSIMIVVLSVLVGGFAQYSYRQIYVGYVSDIRDQVSETRQRTLASYQDTVYGVYVGTSTIEFFQGTTPVAGATNNTIVTIPPHMTATTSFSDTNWYITFARITGGASATGTITFEDTRINASTTFTIYASGLVE